MSDIKDFFKKGRDKAFRVKCDCSASKNVYAEDGKPFKYTHKDKYVYGDDQDIDILILVEYREAIEYWESFINVCKSVLNNANFAIINSCCCTPLNKKDDVMPPFITCKKFWVEDNIRKINPKTIVTVGRSIYTITESKDINYTHFFIPVQNKYLDFQIDDTYFYSSEFRLNVFPTPPLIHYMGNDRKSNEFIVKDVYEVRFVKDQLLRALDDSKKIKRRIPAITCKEIDNPNEFIEEIISNDEKNRVVIDTESKGLNYFEDELISIQFATDNNSGYFCWLKDIDINLLTELFNTNKTFIMHNGIYDCIVLKVNGVENARCDFDTMLAAHSLNENSPNGLKHNTWLYTNFGGFEKETEIYRKKYDVIDFTDIPRELLIKYGCYDVIMTFQLYEYFENRFKLEDPDVYSNYLNYIIPAIPMMVDMHLKGIPVDMTYLKEYNENLVSKQKELDIKITKIFGKKILLTSKKQLSIALLELPEFKPLEDDSGKPLVSKDGNLALNKETLKEYGEQGIEVAPLILEFNHVSKEISQLGVEHFKETGEKKGFLLSMHNGRLYGSYKLHGTGAGRASGGKDKENKESLTASRYFGINPQNIPAEDDFRTIFLAPAGYILGRADYDGMEMVIQSQIAGKGNLENLLLDGKDAHVYTGVSFCKLQGKEISYEDLLRLSKVEEVKEYKQIRDDMKIVNFSCTYGSTKYGLANRFGLTPEEGEGYLNSYYEAYPEVKVYQDDMFNQAQTYGFVKTLLGRKRRLPQLTYIGEDSWKNKYTSSFDIGNLRNVSFNAVIQGTSGQTTIIAMTKIHEEIKARKLKTELIINVHDEIVDLVYLPEIEEYTKMKEYWMTYPYYENQKGATITLTAEQGFGEVWKNEKSLKYWKEHEGDYKELLSRVEKRNQRNKDFTFDDF